MEWVIGWIIFSILVAAIASGKGHNGFGYFFLALIISPILVFLIVLALKPDKERLEKEQLQAGKAKKCPQCAELVKPDAAVCRFCSHTFMQPIPNHETVCQDFVESNRAG